MLLVSSIAQDVLLDDQQVLVKTIESLDTNNTNNNLSLINNFCHKNLRGQIFLTTELCLQRKLASLATKIINRLVIAAPDTKRILMVTFSHLINLISTWTSHCPEAKSALVSNVASSSLGQILVQVINDDNLGDKIIRERIWIPTCFRIITASLTNIECRSWLIRTPKFLNNRALTDLDQDGRQPILEILWLDLLLSLTSFKDGQAWLGKNNELIDVLVEKATVQSSALPSLAILRNLAFHPGARAKLLLLPNYMSLLAQCLKSSETRQKLALTSIWALAANCHKAKVELAKVGITKHLEQLCNSENMNENSLLMTTYAVLNTLT
jgi:hypothetical protein